MNTKNYSYIVLLILLISVITGCFREDHFTESEKAEVRSIEVVDDDKTTIDSATNTISIYVSFLTDYVVINRISFSPLARTRKSFMDSVAQALPFDLRDTLHINVYAESEKVVRDWKIVKLFVNPEPQIRYSKMNEWRVGKDYKGDEISYTGPSGGLVLGYEPGSDAESFSPWKTANEMVKYLGIFAATPSNDKSYAHIITKWNSTAAIVRSGVITGNVFTGNFRSSQSDLPITPTSDWDTRRMLDFGVRYSFKADGVKFKMKYTAGTTVTHGYSAGSILVPILVPTDPAKLLKDNTVMNYKLPGYEPALDSCDVYIVLQNRDDPNQWYRVQSTGFRTSELINDGAGGFSEIVLPLYDNTTLTADILAQYPYLKIGGARGEQTFYKFEDLPPKPGDKYPQYKKTLMPEKWDNTKRVTHAIIVFSSSTYGDIFIGADGSTLDIKDFEFVNPVKTE